MGASKGKHGGRRPRAGRPKNAKSQKTLDAEARALAEKLAQDADDQARPPPGATPLSILEQIAAFWMGIAAKEQADAVSERRQPRLTLLEHALDRADTAAGKAAPFRHSRLAMISVGGQKDMPIEHSVRVVVSEEEMQY